MKRRTQNVRWQIRKSPKLDRQVNFIMTARGFYSYSEMFRTLVREEAQRLEMTKGGG